jgi:hypothetical protein
VVEISSSTLDGWTCTSTTIHTGPENHLKINTFLPTKKFTKEIFYMCVCVCVVFFFYPIVLWARLLETVLHHELLYHSFYGKVIFKMYVTFLESLSPSLCISLWHKPCPSFCNSVTALYIPYILSPRKVSARSRQVCINMVIHLTSDLV